MLIHPKPVDAEGPHHHGEDIRIPGSVVDPVEVSLAAPLHGAVAPTTAEVAAETTSSVDRLSAVTALILRSRPGSPTWM